MKISLTWLRNYIAFDFSAADLASRLTMIGFEVESMETIGPAFEDIVVGEVLETLPHPNADKLKICKVNLGQEIRTVVCGAPNVQTGHTIAFARVGSRLNDKTIIESVSIRGVRSEGMICSERELGLGNDHNGILVLPSNQYKVGERFENRSVFSDTVFELNVTPNRPDCLCHFGIAREIGVITGKKPVFPAVRVPENSRPIGDAFNIQIIDPEKCPRYTARLISDVRIGSSPDWLINRLTSVGMRSINNIVDITNFVMMETGQPLHAFDLELLSGNRIIVRCASPGEEFVTLDNQKHPLTSEDLLICDNVKGVALAGVMGGLNSEVTSKTRHVLLESAHFHPMTIRKTAKRLGISTEASHRFERGTDPGMTLYAADRAAQLFAELAGGTVSKGILDNYPNPLLPHEMELNPSRISELLGIDIPSENVVSILSGLGLETHGKTVFQVNIPTFRRDLHRDVDLIEEIIRHYGYDKIEPDLHSSIQLSAHRNQEHEFSEVIRDALSGFGLLEVLNNSLVSPKHVSAIASERVPVTIHNPLSPDNGFLRTTLIPGLLDSVAWNKNRSENNLHLFEIGRIFSVSTGTLPDEKTTVAGVFTGMKRTKHFWNEKGLAVDFYDVKGLIQSFFNRMQIHRIVWVPVTVSGVRSDTSLAIRHHQTELGFMGEVEVDVSKRWGIDVPVFAFELNIQKMISVLPKNYRYTTIPRYPSIYRDLAFVMDESVSVGTFQKAVADTGSEYLFSVDIFDLYRGKQIEPGKKSVALSLQFLSKERTLKEEEVDPLIKNIIRQMEKQFSATLRT